MSASGKMAMADCFYVTLGWDTWRNCSLCLWKCIKFQTWGAKIVSKEILSDFFFQYNSLFIYSLIIIIIIIIIVIIIIIILANTQNKKLINIIQ